MARTTNIAKAAGKSFTASCIRVAMHKKSEIRANVADEQPSITLSPFVRPAQPGPMLIGHGASYPIGVKGCSGREEGCDSFLMYVYNSFRPRTADVSDKGKLLRVLT